MISEKSFVLMLRLHPKEDLPEGILSNYSRVRLITDKNIPRLDLYEIADCVIGYDTMMLVEAANAGCPAVSVQFPEIDYIPERNLIELAGMVIYTAHNEIEFSEIFKNNLAYERQPSVQLSNKISVDRQKKNSYLEILFNEFSS
jgi:predicted glycosyltransferase